MLFKNPRMAIFFLFAMMLGAVLQITNVFGNPFLHDFARNPEFADSFVVKYPSILLSVSQMAEVGFILTIPFFLKRFGIKTVMLMSMVAWTLRFGFFAYGDPSPTGFILLLLSMIVYGCAFDFFNISGSVFVEQEVDSSIRASARGLFYDDGKWRRRMGWLDSERYGSGLLLGGWRKRLAYHLADVCRVCSFPRSDIFLWV